MNTTASIALAAGLLGGAYLWRRRRAAATVKDSPINTAGDRSTVEGSIGLGDGIGACAAVALANPKAGLACGASVVGINLARDAFGGCPRDRVFIRGEVDWHNLWGSKDRVVPKGGDRHACTNKPSDGYIAVCCGSTNDMLVPREDWERACSLPRRRC